MTRNEWSFLRVKLPFWCSLIPRPTKEFRRRNSDLPRERNLDAENIKCPKLKDDIEVKKMILKSLLMKIKHKTVTPLPHPLQIYTKSFFWAASPSLDLKPCAPTVCIFYWKKQLCNRSSYVRCLDRSLYHFNRANISEWRLSYYFPERGYNEVRISPVFGSIQLKLSAVIGIIQIFRP